MSLKGLGAAFVLTLGSFAITYQQPQKISLFAKDRKAASEAHESLKSLYTAQKDAVTSAEKATATLCNKDNFPGEKRELCQILTKAYHGEYTKYAADNKQAPVVDLDDAIAQLAKHSHVVEHHGKH